MKRASRKSNTEPHQALVTTTPVVIVKDNQTFANSRDVAEFFGKNHKDALKSLSVLEAGLSAQKFAQWFVATVSETKVGFGIHRDPSFDITQQGFSLLAMRFTGSKALQFQLRYIEEFERMEQALKGPQLPDFMNPAESARAWAAEFEAKTALAGQVDALESKIEEAIPKVDA